MIQMQSVLRLSGKAWQFLRERGPITTLGLGVRKFLSPVADVGIIYFFECDIRVGLRPRGSSSRKFNVMFCQDQARHSFMPCIPFPSIASGASIPLPGNIPTIFFIGLQESRKSSPPSSPTIPRTCGRADVSLKRSAVCGT